MSTLASRIKIWYVTGKWTKTIVENVYRKGKITKDERDAILAAKED